MQADGLLIHETAIVADDCQIGAETRVWQFANIMGGTSIGKKCNIGQNVFIETGVRIGDRVKIKNNVALYTGVICEDDVFLGPSCVFTNVINPRSFVERKSEFQQTIIKQGATIGANATILCGHMIGAYAMIGAGAVVTKDVPDFGLVIGNPGRQVGWVCKCGGRLSCGMRDHENGTVTCVECGLTYLLNSGELHIIE